MILKAIDYSGNFPTLLLECLEVSYIPVANKPYISITITKKDGTKENLELPDECSFFVMNDEGKTVDKF